MKLFINCTKNYRVYAKAIPIPTQTDPTNKSVDKATNSQEAKHTAVSELYKF